mgnify:CR=1 FL=1
MNLPVDIKDLKDKVVVITGAGGVICSELAKAFAAAGARVALLDLTREKTASHLVKLETAAFAPEYAGILVSGLNAFIEDILIILQPLPPAGMP